MLNYLGACHACKQQGRVPGSWFLLSPTLALNLSASLSHSHSNKSYFHVIFKSEMKKKMTNTNILSPTVRECGTLHVPEHALMNCSHPLQTFSLHSQCSFHCPEGYQLSGPSTLQCLASGMWDNKLPQCVGMWTASLPSS